MARLLLTLLLCAASVSFAQEVVAAEPLPPPGPVEKTTATLKPTPPPPTARMQRSGTIGVGYLGLAGTSPLFSGMGGLGGLAGLGLLRVQAPILGVRWWLRDSRLGVDLGLGAMVTGGTDMTGAAFVTTPSVQVVAHVGLPIALASTQHVIVLVAPEFRAGYVTLLGDSSFGLSGSLLELALRGAVELFFGFIGVPELSMEAAIRVGFIREAQGMSNFAPLGASTRLTSETYRFSTSLSGDPGSIIASTLSLKYYF